MNISSQKRTIYRYKDIDRSLNSPQESYYSTTSHQIFRHTTHNDNNDDVNSIKSISQNEKTSKKSLYKNQPLHGIRVLDLSRVLAGPFTSMLLGDLGADVIKVESFQGDDTRQWGPPFAKNKNTDENDRDTIIKNKLETRMEEESAYYLCVNRNKRSIVIDFKTKEGLDLMYQLVKESDIFLSNILPKSLERAGLSYQNLKEINPKLIYASITGFGPDGPHANRPGYDVIVQGMYGMMSITGPQGKKECITNNSLPFNENGINSNDERSSDQSKKKKTEEKWVEGESCRTGVALTDISTGLFTHGAILAALYQREKTGKGQRLDASLMESQLAVLANIGQNWLLQPNETKLKPKKWGSAHPSIVPYQAFTCKDGLDMVVGAGNDAQFERLCEAIGLKTTLLDDQTNFKKFSKNKDRIKNREELLVILKKTFLNETRKHWLSLFENIGKGLPFGPIRDVGEAFYDEQAIHRDMVIYADHPTIGKLPLAGFPVKYSGLEGEKGKKEEKNTSDKNYEKGGCILRYPPPLLAQHTDEILKDILHFDEIKIKELRSRKVLA